MAANFTVQTEHRTVQVLGPTQVIDVQEIGFVTHPSEVFAIKRVPFKVWLAAGSGPLVAALADGIEQALVRPGVIGASYVEDLDPSGLLVGFIEFVLEAAPASPDQLGPFTTSVLVNVNQIAGRDESRSAGAALIDQALAALEQSVTL